MTPKEAIEVFNNPTQHWTNEREQAITLAIEALEKQIPKKPAHDFRGLYDFCSACYKNARHIMVSIPENTPKIKYNFCPYCGQAIDWTEVEE